MRECPRNYAHGPMKLVTKTVDMEYRGELFRCEKTVYSCNYCNYELHQDWMREQLHKELEEAYRKRHESGSKVSQ